MSAEQRAEFEKQQRELQDALKNCPVPRIIVEEHNKAAASK
jgi:ferredoxin